MATGSFQYLTAYKKAFVFTMEIFEITKKFPSEEKYELTGQIRRSYRVVCRAIGEGFRRYPKHFSSKMSNADMKNTESMPHKLMSKTCQQSFANCQLK